MMTKNASQSNMGNALKTVELIQLEGSFRIRKIFTSRSVIPADPLEQGREGGIVAGSSVFKAENLMQAVMSGQRVEQIPKNFDFAP